MTLWWILAITVVSFGVLFALFSYSLLWWQRRVGRQFEQNFADANQIIQTRRPPTAWVQPARLQAKRLQDRGGDPVTLARTGKRARQRCLQRLRGLIRLLENGRFYDSLETRALIVEKLEEVYGQWLHEPWEWLVNQ
jgi:hypothetical protein